jgi:hypothetical protein
MKVKQVIELRRQKVRELLKEKKVQFGLDQRTGYEVSQEGTNIDHLLSDHVSQLVHRQAIVRHEKLGLSQSLRILAQGTTSVLPKSH